MVKTIYRFHKLIFDRGDAVLNVAYLAGQQQIPITP
jgi:hypothetical protein